MYIHYQSVEEGISKAGAHGVVDNFEGSLKKNRGEDKSVREVPGYAET